MRVGFVVAERVLFLPSIGFCMLLALVLQHILPHADDDAPEPEPASKGQSKPTTTTVTATVVVVVALLVIGGFSVRFAALHCVHG